MEPLLRATEDPTSPESVVDCELVLQDDGSLLLALLVAELARGRRGGRVEEGAEAMEVAVVVALLKGGR